MFMTSAFKEFVYFVAIETLPRVGYKERPHVEGVALSQDHENNKILVHWGVIPGRHQAVVIQTWVDVDELVWNNERTIDG